MNTEGNIELEEMGINFDTEAYNSAEVEYIRQSINYLNNNSSLVYSDNSALRNNRNDINTSTPVHGTVYSASESAEHNEEFEDATERNWEIDLIEEVRKYPCIWDTRSRSFKETPKKK